MLIARGRFWKQRSMRRRMGSSWLTPRPGSRSTTTGSLLYGEYRIRGPAARRWKAPRVRWRPTRNPDKFLSGIQTLYNDPERDSFDVLHFKDGRVFERYSIPQRLGHEIVGRVWSFHDVTEREKLLRRALFLSDATRLLSSLDVEPALDSVAHLAVPYLGDLCAIDLLGNGHPRRLIVVGRESVNSFSPDLHNSVLTGHSTIYSAGSRSCLAVPLVVKGAVTGAITLVGPPRRNYSGEDLEFAETLASRAALAIENGRLYREAQEALQARDEFLAVAAHEIRGPITSVHMAVQGLQRGKLPAAAGPKVLEIIEREDRRLARFVDELLDLGRIQSGQIYFTFEEVDLAELVRSAVTDLKSELTKSGSSLSINTMGHPVGEWDKFRLQQVATNLISNAIKFGEGKPITVHVSEEGGVTAFSVRTMELVSRPKCWTRSSSPSNAAFPRATTPGSDSGCLSCGPSLKVWAALSGCRAGPEWGRPSWLNCPIQGEFMSRNRAPILIIEDDEDIRELLTVLLEAEGYRVNVAADGLQARDKLLTAGRPALIILDWMMPRVDGEQFLTELRAGPFGDTPVVVLSGNEAAQEKARSLKAECLKKPVEFEDLAELLNRLLFDSRHDAA